MNFTRILMASALILTVSAPAMAGPAQREARQEARIEQGVQSGALTGKETAALEKGQTRVDKAEDIATKDGVVTKKEKAKLAAMQKKQSHRIYNMKHNKKTAN